jgi:hypothetical protein
MLSIGPKLAHFRHHHSTNLVELCCAAQVSARARARCLPVSEGARRRPERPKDAAPAPNQREPDIIDRAHSRIEPNLPAGLVVP